MISSFIINVTMVQAARMRIRFWQSSSAKERSNIANGQKEKKKTHTHTIYTHTQIPYASIDIKTQSFENKYVQCLQFLLTSFKTSNMIYTVCR